MMYLLHTLTSFTALKDTDLLVATDATVGSDAIASLI
jgi:hypothetical protein